MHLSNKDGGIYIFTIILCKPKLVLVQELQVV